MARKKIGEKRETDTPTEESERPKVQKTQNGTFIVKKENDLLLLLLVLFVVPGKL